MKTEIGVAPEWRSNAKVLYNVLKQFPFAWMKTLNRLIREFQDYQRKHQLDVFEIRKKTYWRNAVKIPPGAWATKKKLESRLQILPKADRKTGIRRYDIWFRQEEGGLRRPLRGRKHLAIPTESSEVERTTYGIIKAKERPERLRGKGDFTIPSKKGGELLFQRMRKPGETAKMRKFKPTARSTRAGGGKLSLREDPHVRYLYYLAPSASIDPVYEFYDNAKMVFESRWRQVFQEEVRKAFADAADYWTRRAGAA